MNQYNTTPGEEKNQQLWTIAKKRAGFKRDLAVYFVVNVFLWLVWLLTGAKTNNSGIPWPVWSTAGWGIGMVFYYLSVYRSADNSLAEKEYRKLQQHRYKQ